MRKIKITKTALTILLCVPLLSNAFDFDKLSAQDVMDAYLNDTFNEKMFKSSGNKIRDLTTKKDGVNYGETQNLSPLSGLEEYYNLVILSEGNTDKKEELSSHCIVANLNDQTVDVAECMEGNIVEGGKALMSYATSLRYHRDRIIQCNNQFKYNPSTHVANANFNDFQNQTSRFNFNLGDCAAYGQMTNTGIFATEIPMVWTKTGAPAAGYSIRTVNSESHLYCSRNGYNPDYLSKYCVSDPIQKNGVGEITGTTWGGMPVYESYECPAGSLSVKRDDDQYYITNPESYYMRIIVDNSYSGRCARIEEFDLKGDLLTYIQDDCDSIHQFFGSTSTVYQKYCRSYHQYINDKVWNPEKLSKKSSRADRMRARFGWNSVYWSGSSWFGRYKYSNTPRNYIMGNVYQNENISIEDTSFSDTTARINFRVAYIDVNEARTNGKATFKALRGTYNLGAGLGESIIVAYNTFFGGIGDTRLINANTSNASLSVEPSPQVITTAFSDIVVSHGGSIHKVDIRSTDLQYIGSKKYGVYQKMGVNNVPVNMKVYNISY